MKLRTALDLGRVSNLPTVWSNCLAGALLTGTELSVAKLVWVTLAISLMYLGGMFLNDAFDADWDTQFKPERPIPSGKASAREVWFTGTALLALALSMLVILRLVSGDPEHSLALASGALLVLAIVTYDRIHKRAAYAPWVMGACRLLVYITAGLTVGTITPSLAIHGLSLMCYIAGLTYAARSEHLNQLADWWPLALLAIPMLLAVAPLADQPVSAAFLLALTLWVGLQLRRLLPGQQRDVPAGVGGLLAGIPLIDATVLAGLGQWLGAGLALIAFAITLMLHKRIAGT